MALAVIDLRGDVLSIAHLKKPLNVLAVSGLCGNVWTVRDERGDFLNETPLEKNVVTLGRLVICVATFESETI